MIQTLPPRQMVSDYVALMKPRIVLLILITAFTSMWVASSTLPSPWLLLSTLIGAGLAAGAANALNCYIDRDIDAVMHRTRKRPLPAGRLTPRQALAFGIVTSAVSFVWLWQFVNLLSAVIALSGILFYVFIYTMWLKRSTPQNIVIGGAAGSVPPLIGWAAVTGRVELPALILFLIIFLWTPPHFWALALFRNEDYERAKIPMMPAVRGAAVTKRQILWYSILLVPVSLAPPLLQVTGPVYAVTAGLLGLGLVGYSIATLRDPGDTAAKKLFRFSVVYLGVLFFALMLDRFVGSLFS